MPSYSFDGRDKKNEIRDLLFERSGLGNRYIKNKK